MKVILTKAIFSLVLAFTLLPALALAQPTNPGSGGTPGPGSGGNPPINVEVVLENPFRVGDNLYQVLEAVVRNVIMPIGGVLCVLAFIYAGFMYVTAQGNPTKIANANRMLLYAAIGTAVLLGSWVLATVVRNTITALTT